MLDLSYFQNNNSNVQGFFNGGTWQTWIKPRGAKMVNFFVVGSGAGGGGGFQSATTHGGGGSGGTGAIARLTINANLLPDRLYILPGIGGNGGLGGITGVVSSGSSGQNSFVTLIPDTTSISNIILRSGTIASVGGGAGQSNGNGGGAGGGETVGVVGNNIFANLGNFTLQAGVNGTAGQGGGATSVTPSNFLVASMGGGSTSTAGSFNTTGVFPAIPGTPINTNGRNGIILYRPTLILYGGGGGGGSTSGNGGNGGNGAPGTGGGGGGGSTNTGVNAGNGGRGGDGFIIITTSL